MGLITRLFFRSPITPVATTESAPDPNLSAEPPEGFTRVPPEHHVTVYSPSNEPVAKHCHGGTLIADLGTSSDEFKEECRQIIDEIDRLVSQEELRPVLIATDFQNSSDLFAPNDVRLVPLAGLLLWVIDVGSAALWLREPEPLLAALRRAGAYRFKDEPITQIVMLVVPRRLSGTVEAIRAGEAPRPEALAGTSELARILSESGVSMRVVPDEDKPVFFFEVCRPIGDKPNVVISALRALPSEQSLPLAPKDSATMLGGSTPTGPACPSVTRAPRLRRLTIDWLDRPSRSTWNALMEELLSRQFALIVIVEKEGQWRVRSGSWSKGAKGISVFPDFTSLLQAGADLQLRLHSFASAEFSPHDLFNWVIQETSGGVGLSPWVSVDCAALPAEHGKRGEVLFHKSPTWHLPSDSDGLSWAWQVPADFVQGSLSATIEMRLAPSYNPTLVPPDTTAGHQTEWAINAECSTSTNDGFSNPNGTTLRKIVMTPSNASAETPIMISTGDLDPNNTCSPGLGLIFRMAINRLAGDTANDTNAAGAALAQMDFVHGGTGQQ
jgi:hypothetical protein